MDLVFKKNTEIRLIMLFPIFFILMPRPEIANFSMLMYLTMAYVFGMISIFLIMRNGLHKSTVFTVVLMILLMMIMMVSAFIGHGGFSSLSHLAKIILFMVIFLFGSFIGRLKDRDLIFKGLLKSSYIILFAQLIVSITHYVGSDIFSVIYSMDNVIVSMKRVTGTLANPSFFAWIVVQMAVVIFLLENKNIKKIIWLSIAFGLVFISGSRSMFLLFPVAILLAYVISKRKTPVFMFVKLPAFLVMIGILAYLGYQYLVENALKYPYLSQILSFFETGDLTSIHSFHARTVMWNDALYQLGDNWVSWLFGFGAGSVSVLDNDYLYAIVNYGLLYTVLIFFMYLTFLIRFFRSEDVVMRSIGVQYIILSLVIGYQAETLNGWNYPLLLLFYTGIVTSLNYKYAKQRAS